jgi:hypothetical protein
MENIESMIKMPNISENFSRKKRNREDNFKEKEEINNQYCSNNINNKRKNDIEESLSEKSQESLYEKEFQSDDEMSEDEEKIDSIVFNYGQKELSTSIKLEMEEKDEEEKKNKQTNNINLPEHFSRNFVSSQLVDMKHKSDLGFIFVFNEI